MFSHLNKHKLFKFNGVVSHISDCNSKTETTEHFSLYCPLYTNQKQEILNNIYEKDNLIKTSNEELCKVVLPAVFQ